MNYSLINISAFSNKFKYVIQFKYVIERQHNTIGFVNNNINNTKIKIPELNIDFDIPVKQNKTYINIDNEEIFNYYYGVKSEDEFKMTVNKFGLNLLTQSVAANQNIYFIDYSVKWSDLLKMLISMKMLSPFYIVGHVDVNYYNISRLNKLIEYRFNRKN